MIHLPPGFRIVSEEEAEDLDRLDYLWEIMERVAEAAQKRYLNRGGTYGTDMFWEDKLRSALEEWRRAKERAR